VRTRIRVLIAVAGVALVVGLTAAPAFAQDAEPNFADKAAEECHKLLEEGKTVDDCQKAPNPLVPELNAIFDWTHSLHRQLYDVLADERLDSAARDNGVARLLRYYASRRDLALSRMPKSMMEIRAHPRLRKIAMPVRIPHKAKAEKMR